MSVSPAYHAGVPSPLYKGGGCLSSIATAESRILLSFQAFAKRRSSLFLRISGGYHAGVPSLLYRVPFVHCPG